MVEDSSLLAADGAGVAVAAAAGAAAAGGAVFVGIFLRPFFCFLPRPLLFALPGDDAGAVFDDDFAFA